MTIKPYLLTTPILVVAIVATYILGFIFWNNLTLTNGLLVLSPLLVLIFLHLFDQYREQVDQQFEEKPAKKTVR